MPRTFFTITANDLPALRQQLNSLFSQLMIDLQRIEGLDGATPKRFQDVDMSNKKLINVTTGADSTDSASIADLFNLTGNQIITGNFTVTGTVTFSTSLDIDNLQLNGNSIISTNTDGNINITPNGTGKVVLGNQVDIDNLNLNGNTLSTINTNGDLILAPNGTGNVKTANDLEHTGTNVGFFSTAPTTQASHITDASTSHAVTDPADTPATADILRDDLVANTIPSMETALNSLGTKINSILLVLERHGLKSSV